MRQSTLLKKVWAGSLFLFFLYVASPGFSQNLKLIATLRDSTRQAQSDSARAVLYNELCKQWAEFNFDSSWYYAKEVLAIGHQLENHLIIRQGINAKGVSHDYQNNFDSAIYYYRSAADYAKLHNDQLGIASGLFNLGVVHSFKGEMEQAIENYLEAGQVFSQLEDDIMLGKMHNNLGIIYRKVGKYTLAKEAYLKSLALKEKQGDKSGILRSTINIGVAYRYMKVYDSAILFSKKALLLAKELGNENDYMHELIHLAVSYEEMGFASKAAEAYTEAETLIDEDMPYETQFQVFLGLAKFHLDNGALNKSKAYLNKLEDVLDTSGHVELQYNFHELAYRVALKMGDKASALTYLEKAHANKTALLNSEVLSKTTELEQLFEKEKRELEINKLNADNEIQRLRLEQNTSERNLLLLFSLMVIVVALLLYYLYRKNKRSLIEREMLLREIHHRVKNNLQIISSLLKLQAGNLDNEAAIGAVKEGQARVNAMALIHKRLYSADDVRGVNIQEYLESLVYDIFAAFGVGDQEVGHSITTDNIHLDIDTVIPLGLIVNELITNSIKYAFSGKIQGWLEVDVKEQGGKLLVVVCDNGKGMTAEDMQKLNTFGWRMIHSLSRKLKAEIQVENQQGTAVTLTISRYKLVA